MTLPISEPAPTHQSTQTISHRGDGKLIWMCWAVVMAMALFRTRDFLIKVWVQGQFHDTDDAMRMVQVRNWMGGQGWFDLTMPRVTPDHPLVMHWTRVLDAPLAGLIWAFQHVALPGRAEILARLTYSTLLLGSFVACVGWVAARLARSTWPLETRLVAMGGCLFIEAITQFFPGRVHHHAPQILLLLGFVAGVLACFDTAPRTRTWGGLAAALCAALSLAIGLENLPFLAVGGAGLVVAWVTAGTPLRGALLSLGLGLASALPLLFAGFVNPAEWGHPVCDTLSLPFLITGVLGGLGLVGLAGLSSGLPTWQGRLLAALGLGGGVVGVFALGFPQCLHDPLSSPDPLIAMWLRNIAEGRPLPILWEIDKIAVAELLIPNGLGFVAALWLARKSASEPGPAAVWTRGPCYVLAALIGVGTLGGCWQIRVDSSTSAITLLVSAVAAVRLGLQKADPHRLVSRLVWALAALFPLTQAPENLLETTVAQTRYPASTSDETCFKPMDFAGLERLPASLLFNPIDSGAYMLAHTKHIVTGASYHRANAGNRLVLQAFMSPAEEAEAFVRQSGARYLIHCPGLSEENFEANRAPRGLAADLRDGRVPPWLQRVDVPGPIQVFELRTQQ